MEKLQIYGVCSVETFTDEAAQQMVIRLWM